MAAVPEIPTGGGAVMIGIDAHKRSWTAGALDARLQPCATLRVPADDTGYRALRRFARQWPNAEWAIESATGVGAALTGRLRTDRIEVIDVPAKLSARVRVLSRGHGRKTDDTDAVSVAIAAATAPHLPHAELDPDRTVLRALIEHRDDLVKTHTQTINRLHGLLADLTPGGAAPGLTAARAAHLLRGVRPHDHPGTALRALAVDLVAEVRQLDRRITKATNQIHTALAATGTTLTQLCGIADLSAAKILAHVGSIDRFRSPAAFATYTGTAPIETSSGQTVRHRLNRAGNRQLNACLHLMALTRIRHDPTTRAYYQRKRSEGKSRREALRCVKRRLSDLVYRTMLADTTPAREADPGGHSGTTLNSSVTGSHPDTGTSDQPHPDPRPQPNHLARCAT